MKNLHKSIPSPQALIAFEAAARHRSFTQAAQELNVTQVAVTYQVKKLEEDIDTPLFHRHHRSVSPTLSGQRLFEAVRHGFDHIADAVLDIQKFNAGDTVIVAANNAVSFHWLRPRVTAFQRANPKVEFKIISSDLEDFDPRDGIDLSIRFGRGVWPGFVSERLFDEVVVPICSPGYRDRNGGFRWPDDFKDATLLQFEPVTTTEINWTSWLQAAGMGFVPSSSNRVLTFTNYPVLLEAAIAGEGLALGWRSIIDPLLEDNKVVPVCDLEVRTDAAYFVCVPEKRQGKAVVDDFMNALLADSRL